MDASRKEIQSVVTVFGLMQSLFLDLCNIKEILRMIARNNLLYKSYLVCFDINEGYDIG